MIIAIVSAVDIYWLSRNRITIMQEEANPIGQYLLELDNGDVSLFILIKILGTDLAIAILYILWYVDIKHIHIIGAAIALAQSILLFYLMAPSKYYLEIFYP